MTKESYLKILRANLNNVPPYEADNIMQYYIEYFEEAGPANVDKVIAELGNPKQLAQRVTADYVIRDIESGNGNRTVKQKATNTWLLVLGIISSPIIALVAFVVAIVVLALIVSFFAVAVAFVVVAAVTFFAGVFTLFSSTGFGLLLIGLSLVFIALTIFMVLAAVGIIKLVELLIMFFAKRKIKK
ncbi:MAG: DUF1700 domain-containing protein [Lachnospira sp.]|nr:DUF1700 domain-containing protein [Lachnospira sp.]